MDRERRPFALFEAMQVRTIALPPRARYVLRPPVHGALVALCLDFLAYRALFSHPIPF